MEIRDPVHGSIPICDEEKKIVEHRYFQRLRQIKQLGFSEFVFPGATHTRYLHSLGVMHISSLAFDRLFGSSKGDPELLRLRQTLKLAALLHDIGHAPLSHATESVMPMVAELKIPSRFHQGELQRRAGHEDYTIKSIVDSQFAEAFKDCEASFGISRFAIAEVIIGKTTDPGYFQYKGLNLFPLMHQLVSSEMDCDRMDYLLRDSYFCGVSYGKFDLDWILDNLQLLTDRGDAMIGISERAVATFDDFLLSRFHMFLMVYFHYKSVCLEQMLFKYFAEKPEEYRIPADIEDYQNHDDHFLLKVLKSSKNIWARRIVLNNIPEKVFESFGNKDLETMARLETYLQKNKIPYLAGSSKNRLSKYYTAGRDDESYPYSLKVIRKGRSGNILRVENIDQATDLYKKFKDTHEVNRIHCDFEELENSNKKDIIEILEGHLNG